MTTLGSRDHGTEPGVDADEAGVRRFSPRDTVEALALLLVVLGILLGLALTLGTPFPIGP